jgi:hypothetical protein
MYISGNALPIFLRRAMDAGIMDKLRAINESSRKRLKIDIQRYLNFLGSWGVLQSRLSHEIIPNNALPQKENMSFYLALQRVLLVSLLLK